MSDLLVNSNDYQSSFMTNDTKVQINRPPTVPLWVRVPEFQRLIGPVRDVAVFYVIFAIIHNMYRDWYVLSSREWLRKHFKLLAMLALYFMV